MVARRCGIDPPSGCRGVRRSAAGMDSRTRGRGDGDPGPARGPSERPVRSRSAFSGVATRRSRAQGLPADGWPGAARRNGARGAVACGAATRIAAVGLAVAAMFGAATGVRTDFGSRPYRSPDHSAARARRCHRDWRGERVGPGAPDAPRFGAPAAIATLPSTRYRPFGHRRLSDRRDRRRDPRGSVEARPDTNRVRQPAREVPVLPRVARLEPAGEGIVDPSAAGDLSPSELQRLQTAISHIVPKHGDHCACTIRCTNTLLLQRLQRRVADRRRSSAPADLRERRAVSGDR